MKINTVGVVGLGLLGRGIATCLLGHGLRVVGYTRRDATLAKARRYIIEGIEELVDRAGYSPSLRESWTDRYVETTAFAPLGQCQFIIESVAEDLPIKQAVFDRIEEVVEASVPIASNTSAIPIRLLQSNLRHPERLLGMHWAEPAHATRFLELIRGEQTSDEAMYAAERLGRDVGKDPSLVQKDVPGFIVNRLGYAMMREALHLLQSGVADAETIDRSFRNAIGLWASMCGPLRWIDLTGGPALYARAMAQVLGDLSHSENIPASLQELADRDSRGIADGQGFYRYTPEQASAWEARLHEQAWAIRDLMNRYDPLEDVKTDG